MNCPYIKSEIGSFCEFMSILILGDNLFVLTHSSVRSSNHAFPDAAPLMPRMHSIKPESSPFESNSKVIFCQSVVPEIDFILGISIFPIENPAPASFSPEIFSVLIHPLKR